MRPSHYLVIDAFRRASGPVTEAGAVEHIDNQKLVAALKGTSGQGCAAKLREIPEHLGTAVLARAASDLLDSLVDVLSAEENIASQRHNPLLANGLHGLRNIAELLPSLATNSARFGNAYRAMLEEMQLVLREAKPYTLDSFKSAASARLSAALAETSLPGLAEPEAFLTSSGMQALVQGLDLANVLSKNGIEALPHADRVSPLYYEGLAYLVAVPPKRRDPNATPAFHASLGDSYVHAPGQPSAGWSVDDVVAGIDAQVAQRRDTAEPLTVVLDTTIEHEGDLKKLMSTLGPHLANDRLRLLLCKSHQKFANLSSSKVTGGSVALVGAATPMNERLQAMLRQSETKQAWFHNDESQLLTHLTRAAQTHEPALLQRAIDNGNFVVGQCFNGRDGHTRFAGHAPDQPFAMVNCHDGVPTSRLPGFVFEVPGGAARKPMLPIDMLNSDALRERGSFGFSESTINNIGRLAGYGDTLRRVAFGQVNHTELIERFWMPSREMKLDHRLLDSCQALAEAMTLVNDALTPQQRRELTGRPLSQKLRYIGQLEAAAPSDAERTKSSATTLRGIMAAPKGFTLNKVVSIVGHVDHLLRSADAFSEFAPSRDREFLQSLLDGLIASGMPNVSPSGREKVIALQGALCLADMRSDNADTRRSGVDTLLASLDHSGVSPLVGLFNHSIPDTAYALCPAAVKEQLRAAIFDPLDIQSKLSYLNANTGDKTSLAFIGDCSRHLAGQLKNTTGADTDRHWRQTLGAEMIKRGIVTPRPA